MAGNVLHRQFLQVIIHSALPPLASCPVGFQHFWAEPNRYGLLGSGLLYRTTNAVQLTDGRVEHGLLQFRSQLPGSR